MARMSPTTAWHGRKRCCPIAQSIAERRLTVIMPKPQPPQPTNPRRFRWRRLVQYRLRTLLIFTTIVAVWLGNQHVRMLSCSAAFNSA